MNVETQKGEKECINGVQGIPNDDPYSKMSLHKNRKQLKGQGRYKHEKEWINGRDDEIRTYGWWSYGVSRHLMGWNHKDK